MGAQNLFFRHALLPSGWAKNVRVGIAGGLISAIEPGAVAGPEVYDIGLPGMPNLHSHTFQRAIAGLTEYGGAKENFWTWRDMMYRFALRMSPDDVEIVATQAFIEMLEGGFCAVAEFHYLHHAPDGSRYADIGEMAARIGAAAAAAGIDLTLLPVFYAHAGFGGTPPAPAQRRFINDLDSYGEILARCEKISATGIAPHSLRAVTPAELSVLAGWVGDKKPLHIHIAEQTGEVAECIAWSGLRPVEFLLRHQQVGRNWCLVHATHVDEGECDGMARAGAVVGLCPITEANLGDGVFPAQNFGGAYGIGSDSNVLIGVAEELRMLEYAQRLVLRRRNIMASPAINATATSMYTKAVAGGAQALGVQAGLTVGAPANIVSCAGENPDVAMAQAVFSARSSTVENVWVRGRKCVVDGIHGLAENNRAKFDDIVRRLASN